MFMDTNEQGFNHYCKICKKGFGCGRALGGHMRAHGIISDDNNNAQFTDDEDNNNNNNNKRMYALRANPNRLKNCRSCGKDFSSWKSFLEHGRCGGADPEEEEEESLVSGYASDEEDRLRWSKGKRSRRTKAVSGVVDGPSEEEDLAYCLLMLSTAAAAAASAAANVGPSTGVVAETEESCASASRDEDNQHHPNRAVIAAPPITIGLIEWPVPRPGPAPGPSSSGGPRGVFECKACKKVFTSHQALGGHRASHKKVKGCFAARLDESARQEDPGGGGDAREEERLSSMKSAIVLYEAGAGKSAHAHAQGRKAKVHECSICHRVFASGQALGGHKRCHWITSNSIEVGARERPPREAGVSNVRLDLNLPAPEEMFGQQGPWIGLRTSMENNTSEFDNNNETLIYNNLNNNVDGDDDNNNVNYSRRDDGGEEAESKAKMARLSELKELSLGGGGGGGGGGVGGDWLQVGIGSSGNGSCDP